MPLCKRTGSKKLTILLIGLIIIGGGLIAYSLFTGFTGEEMPLLKSLTEPEFRSPDPQKNLIDPERGVEFASGELLVVAGAEVSPEVVEDIVGKVEGKITGSMEQLGIFQVDIPGEDLQSLENARKVLAGEEKFKAILFNYVDNTNVSERIPDVPQWTDKSEMKRWGQEVINLTEAWSITTGSADVGIGIVDSGFYIEHPDLKGTDFLLMNDRGLAEESLYNYDHGTRVAGIVGALATNEQGMAGVVWEPSLTCYFTSYLTERAMAVSHAIKSEHIRVINISMGPYWGHGEGKEIYYCEEDNRGRKEFWRPFVKEAGKSGLLIVQAAGNNPNLDVCRMPLPSLAADYDNVITVGAINRNLERIYSSGEAVTVSAPGHAIWSARTDFRFWRDPYFFLGEEPYDYASGTSFAAPFVTGVAGLMLSVDPQLSPAEIKEIIMVTAIAYPDWDSDWGSGIVNAAGAVEAVKERAAEVKAAIACGDIHT